MFQLAGFEIEPSVEAVPGLVIAVSCVANFTASRTHEIHERVLLAVDADFDESNVSPDVAPFSHNSFRDVLQRTTERVSNERRRASSLT